jgi:hypothetical protein
MLDLVVRNVSCNRLTRNDATWRVYVGSRDYVSVLRFSQGFERRRGAVVDGIARGYIDIKQKVEATIEGENTNVAYIGTFFLIFCMVVGRFWDP